MANGKNNSGGRKQWELAIQGFDLHGLVAGLVSAQTTQEG
jgi:hypothetical protein